ncbi:hypothetical protein TYRP_020913, partial [Tyrophagus putrescentiae]
RVSLSQQLQSWLKLCALGESLSLSFSLLSLPLSPLSPWAAGGAQLLRGQHCTAQGGETRFLRAGPEEESFDSGQRCTDRNGEVWCYLAHQNARRRGTRERSERDPSRRAFLVSQVTPGLKRPGLTTLGHCERSPTRVSRAERAGPESVGVHSAQVSSGYTVQK